MGNPVLKTFFETIGIENRIITDPRGRLQEVVSLNQGFSTTALTLGNK